MEILAFKELCQQYKIVKFLIFYQMDVQYVNKDLS